jgi:hypothetical protein
MTLEGPARETRGLTTGERKNRFGVGGGGARLTPRFADSAAEAHADRARPAPARGRRAPCGRA